MNTTLTDLRFVKAEIEARYGNRADRHARRDSSLAVLRRTMRRNSRRELHPGGW